MHGLRAAFAEIFERRGHAAGAGARRRGAARRQSAGDGDRALHHRAVGALLHPAAGLELDGRGRARHRRRPGRAAAADRRGLRPPRPALPGGGLRGRRRSTGRAATRPSAAAFEKPGRLFADLRAAGCGEVTFAGGMARPELNPLRFDLKMLKLAPQVLAGPARRRRRHPAADRAASSRPRGSPLRAPHELVADLLAPARRADPRAPERGRPQRRRPRRRASSRRWARADVGQGAVVAQGLCLGLESIQGTDAMLDFVARTAAGFRPDPAGGARRALQGAEARPGPAARPAGGRAGDGARRRRRRARRHRGGGRAA